MTQDKKGGKRGKEDNLLMMPDQLRVVPLANMLRDILEADFREYCAEKGLDPDEYKHLFSGDTEKP